MPSLLLVVFIVELAVHLVNTFGASTINNLLWNLFLALPTQISKDFAERRKLQADYLKTRRELNATSSQDQFAKWAKLRRQHDKQLEQLEKMKKSQDSIKTRFDGVITAVRWVGTRGVQFLLPFWFAKQPMLWLPYGWFPYYVEWLMSFPRAPLGSVSIAAWQLACTSVIIVVSDGMKALLALVLSVKQRPEAVPAKESNEKTRSKEATKSAEKEEKDT